MRTTKMAQKSGCGDEKTLEAVEIDESDPAEYLLNTPKYHDCHIMVGNPTSGEIENIGVSKTHLIAHSTVFRRMLEDSEIADPTGNNTEITDFRPAVFKLMLRHVYAGEMPDISREVAVELAMFADKYNMPLLLKRAFSLLVPTSVDNLCPALFCVAYINNAPVLLPSVTEIVQNQTNILIKNKKFLDLDENCLEFIAKQEKLAITELQLWISLVNWVKKKSCDPSEQRKYLRKPLKHVRFMTLSKDDILTEVLNTKILTSNEVCTILSVVCNKEIGKNEELCNNMTKRQFIYSMQDNCWGSEKKSNHWRMFDGIVYEIDDDEYEIDDYEYEIDDYDEAIYIPFP